MKITVNGTQYEFDQNSLTNREAMAIEKVTGWTFTEWAAKMGDGSAVALTAMIWTIQRREDPKVKFDEVEFSYADLEAELEVVDEGEGPRELDPKDQTEGDHN